MRPIDADELIYEIVNTPLAEGFPYDKEWFDRLQSDIHKIIDMVENAPTVNEWISVKERLPEHFQRVLVCDANGSISIALRDHYLDMFVTEDGYDTVQPKWWMQLPESPEVEG